MKIAFLAFEHFEELDLVGPWEVFTMAAAMDRPDLSNVIVSPDGAPLRASKGLEIVPQHGFGDMPQPDILLVPGGRGVDPLLQDDAVLGWIQATARHCTWVTSVCSGALLLQAAGLVKGRRITTHWRRIQQSRELGDVGEVLEGVRYVRDGNVVTAAGVSAGIDMALWLVGELYGARFARQVQTNIEYYPAPPYAAET